MSCQGFYRGTSHDQVPFFANKEKKMIETKKWPDEFEKEVDMSKVNVSVISSWITKRITEILGFEDEIIIDYCRQQLLPQTSTDIGSLSAEKICPKKLQINMTGFLAKNASSFVKDLWSLLLDAQESESGIPSQFVEEQKNEMMFKQAEAQRIKEALEKVHKVKNSQNVLQESEQNNNETNSKTTSEAPLNEEKQRISTKYSPAPSPGVSLSRSRKSSTRGRSNSSSRKGTLPRHGRSPHVKKDSYYSSRNYSSMRRSPESWYSRPNSHTYYRRNHFSMRRRNRYSPYQKKYLSPTRRSSSSVHRREPTYRKTQSSHRHYNNFSHRERSSSICDAHSPTVKSRSSSVNDCRSESVVDKAVRSPRLLSHSLKRHSPHSPVSTHNNSLHTKKLSRSSTYSNTASPSSKKSHSLFKKHTRLPLKKKSRSFSEKHSCSSSQHRTTFSPQKRTRSPLRKPSRSFSEKRNHSSIRRRRRSSLGYRYRPSVLRRYDSSTPPRYRSSLRRRSRSAVYSRNRVRQRYSRSPLCRRLSSRQNTRLPRREYSRSLAKRSNRLSAKKYSHSSTREENCSPMKKNSRSPSKKSSPLPLRKSSSLPINKYSRLSSRRGSYSPVAKNSCLTEKHGDFLSVNKEGNSPVKRDSCSVGTKDSRSSGSRDRRSPQKKKSLSTKRKDSRSPEREDSCSPKRRNSLSQKGKDSLPTRRKDSRSPKRDKSCSSKRKYSCSLVKKHSRSPVRKYSRSPVGKYSRSPVRKYSRSLVRKYSRSPVRKYSRSPVRKYSRSPVRKYSRSPVRKYSRSSMRKYTRLALRKYSRSPIRKYSRSPVRKYSRLRARTYSHSPIRDYSHSSTRGHSRSLARSYSRSPMRRYSRSARRRFSRSLIKKISRHPVRRYSRSPPKRHNRSPIQKRKYTPNQRHSRSSTRKRSISTTRRASRLTSTKFNRSRDNRRSSSSIKRVNRMHTKVSHSLSSQSKPRSSIGKQTGSTKHSRTPFLDTQTKMNYLERLVQSSYGAENSFSDSQKNKMSETKSKALSTHARNASEHSVHSSMPRDSISCSPRTHHRSSSEKTFVTRERIKDNNSLSIDRSFHHSTSGHSRCKTRNGSIAIIKNKDNVRKSPEKIVTRQNSLSKEPYSDVSGARSRSPSSLHVISKKRNVSNYREGKYGKRSTSTSHSCKMNQSRDPESLEEKNSPIPNRNTGFEKKESSRSQDNSKRSRNRKDCHKYIRHSSHYPMRSSTERHSEENQRHYSHSKRDRTSSPVYWFERYADQRSGYLRNRKDKSPRASLKCQNSFHRSIKDNQRKNSSLDSHSFLDTVTKRRDSGSLSRSYDSRQTSALKKLRMDKTSEKIRDTSVSSTSNALHHGTVKSRLTREKYYSTFPSHERDTMDSSRNHKRQKRDMHCSRSSTYPYKMTKRHETCRRQSYSTLNKDSNDKELINDRDPSTLLKKHNLRDVSNDSSKHSLVEKMSNQHQLHDDGPLEDHSAALASSDTRWNSSSHTTRKTKRLHLDDVRRDRPHKSGESYSNDSFSHYDRTENSKHHKEVSHKSYLNNETRPPTDRYSVNETESYHKDNDSNCESNPIDRYAGRCYMDQIGTSKPSSKWRTIKSLDSSARATRRLQL